MSDSRDMVRFIEGRDEYCLETIPEDCSIVIFGASGDLTRRKLIPALFGLFRRGLLPERFLVVGCARGQVDEGKFRELFHASLSTQDEVSRVNQFLAHIHYMAVDYTNTDSYRDLDLFLRELETRTNTSGSRIFYLATPPDLILPISEGLGKAGLVSCMGGTDCRIVIEKPFGSDVASAASLSRSIAAYWPESAIYRIDHYLGKETVQNILVLRFANLVFEPIWNRRYVDHVQITVSEEEGVGTRASYYEQAGALRDMFQNHMLQMLALVGMEPPSTMSAERYREEKLKLLRSVRPFSTRDMGQEVVRGQYAAGVTDGKTKAAYREETGVARSSTVETSVALRLWIDNWRWHGVPFYLRSGKNWPKRTSEIAVVFRQVPHSIFSPITSQQLAQNALVLKIQPAEGMRLTLEAKRPGPRNCMGELALDFDYKDICAEPSPDSYQRLLLDCMVGDRTLFVSAEEVELAWTMLQPILDAWRIPDGPSPLFFYPAGEPGPEEAAELLRRDGREWRPI